MIDENVPDEAADILGFEFRFPSNLAYERLNMARRALTHLAKDKVLPTRESFYLVKNLFRDKGDLTLEFPDGFDNEFRDNAHENRYLEKLGSKDESGIKALKNTIKQTQESVLARLEEIEKNLGLYEYSVGRLCEKLTDLGMVDNKDVIKYMHNILSANLDDVIPQTSVKNAKYMLAKAISAHYPGDPSPLGKFLSELAGKMGQQYPLNNADINTVKVDRKALAVCKTLVQGKSFKRTYTERNITLLVQSLNFNDNQRALLRFFACHEKEHIDNLLKAAQPTADSMEHHINALALLLDMKAKDIKRELRPGGDLVRYGFIAYDDAACSFQVDKSLTKILRGNYDSKEELIAGLLGPSPSSALVPSDYDYTEKYIEMKAHLQGLIIDKDPNLPKTMTAYGPRGTGKSEMTAVLSKDMGIPAFLVGVI